MMALRLRPPRIRERLFLPSPWHRWSFDGGRVEVVPRVADEYLEALVYVYPSLEHAEADKGGGTGFLLSHPFGDDQRSILEHCYVVTARHVLLSDIPNRVPWPEPVIAVGVANRKPRVICTKAGDWIPHADGDDVAIIGDIDLSEADCLGALRSSDLIRPNVIQGYGIGIGDDVMYAGRYQPPNKPSVPTVRFGQISHMSLDVWHDLFKRDVESFLVEARSRGGFSGAPVVVRLIVEATPTMSNDEPPTPIVQRLIPYDRWILGLYWGHVIEEVGKVQLLVNEGMMCVAPAWKIAEILESDRVREQRKRVETKHDEGQTSGRRISLGSLPVEDNPVTREAFLHDLSKIKKQLAQKPSEG
jgi:hypothetical protein